MTDSKITRRQVLLTTGTVALVGLVAAEVPAAKRVNKSPLTYLDGLLSAHELAIAKRELAPHRPDVLQLDLVREWRDALHSRIARGGTLIAITRWDKALLLQELAREAALPVRQERIARSLFRTDIS